MPTPEHTLPTPAVVPEHADELIGGTLLTDHRPDGVLVRQLRHYDTLALGVGVCYLNGDAAPDVAPRQQGVEHTAFVNLREVLKGHGGLQGGLPLEGLMIE